MMKVAVVFLALILGEVAATPFMFQKPKTIVEHAKLDKCKLCIEFSQQFINQLLNIILSGTVVSGCTDLCEILANKTNSPAAGVVCELLCDIVGINEFMEIVEKADLDPIYYCELLNACPIKDDGDATIKSLTVTPKVVKFGSDFTINVVFETVNGTGTGAISLLVIAADHFPLGQLELMEPLAPGSYPVYWGGAARPDPDCGVDTLGPCEEWIPGLYKVQVTICNGECGSKHPHSQIYDQAHTTFNVTKASL